MLDSNHPSFEILLVKILTYWIQQAPHSQM